MAEESRQPQGDQSTNKASQQQEQEQEQQEQNIESASTTPPHGTVLRERRSDEAPSPKKRMWEENTDMARDEL